MDVKGQASKKWWLAGAFVGVLLTQLVFQTPSMGWSPLLPVVKEAFNMNFSQIGLFAGVGGIACLIISIPAGWAVKCFGEKNLF